MAEVSSRRKGELSPQERLFANEVARARAAAKVSQEWVGRQIGLSWSKVSEVCCGWYLPAREAVVLLCDALGMDRERTHVRRRAAMALARWSPMCREEALLVCQGQSVSVGTPPKTP